MYVATFECRYNILLANRPMFLCKCSTDRWHCPERSSQIHFQTKPGITLGRPGGWVPPPGVFPLLPGEAASSPQRGPQVNAQMMTSLPSPLPSPPYPWLIESVQPKLAPEGIPIHFSGSVSADQGIDIASVSFLFVIFWFHCILTFNCMLSWICMLTWKSI